MLRLPRQDDHAEIFFRYEHDAGDESGNSSRCGRRVYGRGSRAVPSPERNRRSWFSVQRDLAEVTDGKDGLRRPHFLDRCSLNRRPSRSTNLPRLSCNWTHLAISEAQELAAPAGAALSSTSKWMTCVCRRGE